MTSSLPSFARQFIAPALPSPPSNSVIRILRQPRATLLLPCCHPTATNGKLESTPPPRAVAPTYKHSRHLFGVCAVNCMQPAVHLHSSRKVAASRKSGNHLDIHTATTLIYSMSQCFFTRLPARHANVWSSPDRGPSRRISQRRALLRHLSRAHDRILHRRISSLPLTSFWNTSSRVHHRPKLLLELLSQTCLYSCMRRRYEQLTVGGRDDNGRG
jgi:hypothetical protein